MVKSWNDDYRIFIRVFCCEEEQRNEVATGIMKVWDQRILKK